jgi:hypothetical protein
MVDHLLTRPPRLEPDELTIHRLGQPDDLPLIGTTATRPVDRNYARAGHRANNTQPPSAVSVEARNVDPPDSPVVKLFSATQPPSTASATPFTYALISLAR